MHEPGAKHGLMCFHAESAAEALEQLEQAVPEMVLTDLVLGDHSGIELLAR